MSIISSNWFAPTPITSVRTRLHDVYCDSIVGVPHITDVMSHGAVGDGVTDDTFAIQQTIDHINHEGGGTVYIPNGNFLVTGLTMYSNVQLRGHGMDATTLTLKAGSNVDVIATKDVYLSIDGSSAGSSSDPHSFAITDMTIDGNASNQSPANPDRCNGIAIFGYGYLLDRIHIKNVSGHGLRCRWNDSTGKEVAMKTTLMNVKVDETRRHGIWFLGPHDSYATNILVIDPSLEADGGYSHLHLDNSGSANWFYFHGWRRGATANTAAYVVNCRSWGNRFFSSVFEGGKQLLVVDGIDTKFVGCSFFANTTTNPLVLLRNLNFDFVACHFTVKDTAPAPCIQIGDTGVGLYPSSNPNQSCQNYQIVACRAHAEGGQPLVKFVNDAGGTIQIRGGSPSGALYTGTPANQTELSLIHESDVTKQHMRGRQHVADMANFRVGVGSDAGSGATGNNQVFLGQNAGKNSSANEAVCIGHNTGLGCTGNLSTCVGQEAGGGVGFGSTGVPMSGQNNTCLGPFSMGSATTAANSTGCGYRTLASVTTGSGNTTLGANAGDLVTTGNNNTCLGFSADTGAAGTLRATAVGANTAASTDGIAIGSSAVAAANQLAIGSATSVITLAGTATGGAGGAVPANAEEYLPIVINGLTRKIPLFLS